jgi:hypothetical protein
VSRYLGVCGRISYEIEVYIETDFPPQPRAEQSIG